MSGPTHFATRKDNRILVEVYGRGRKRYAQEIANDMTASYERVDLHAAEHPSYAFIVTETPTDDLRAENERLTARVQTQEAKLAAVERIIERLDAHTTLESEEVQSRDASGSWWDVADTLREAIA